MTALRLICAGAFLAAGAVSASASPIVMKIVGSVNPASAVAPGEEASVEIVLDRDTPPQSFSRITNFDGGVTDLTLTLGGDTASLQTPLRMNRPQQSNAFIEPVFRIWLQTDQPNLLDGAIAGYALSSFTLFLSGADFFDDRDRLLSGVLDPDASFSGSRVDGQLTFGFVDGPPGVSLVIDQFESIAFMKPADGPAPGVVPLPAPAFLLVGALGVLAALRRRA